MPSHSSYSVVATTKVPLNDDSPLFSSSPPDPCTPPSRLPPKPDLAIHRIRGTARRSVTPLPSSITSSLQQINSSSPPPPTSAQRPRQVSFEELLCELTDHIKDVQKTFNTEEQDFLSHLLLTISSYPDNYIPDAAPIVPSSTPEIPLAIETRLTKQEETLSHILTRLDQLTAPPTRSPIPQLEKKTWANIVEQATPSATNSVTTKASKKRPEPTPEPERTLILKPITPPTNFNPLHIRESINSALINAKLTISVVLVRLSVNNNIVIEVKHGHTAAELKEQESVWSHLVPGLQEVVVRERWYKLVAHSVATDLIVADSEEKQMEAFLEDIETFNHDLQLAAPPRWLTKPEARVGKLHSSLVLSFKTQRELKHALRNRLVIAGTPVKTSEFIDIRPTTHCRNCQKFGHHQRTCRHHTRCQLCAGDHPTNLHTCSTCQSTKECPHTQLKCANCEGSHKATDPRCEVYRNLIRKPELPTTDNPVHSL